MFVVLGYLFQDYITTQLLISLSLISLYLSLSLLDLCGCSWLFLGRLSQLVLAHWLKYEDRRKVGRILSQVLQFQFWFLSIKLVPFVSEIKIQKLSLGLKPKRYQKLSIKDRPRWGLPVSDITFEILQFRLFTRFFIFLSFLSYLLTFDICL